MVSNCHWTLIRCGASAHLDNMVTETGEQEEMERTVSSRESYSGARIEGKRLSVDFGLR